MEVYNCGKSDFKCKTRVKSKGRCGKKIDFSVKCPPPIVPLPPTSSVIYQKYTVGGGGGTLANMYTVNVPAGTYTMTFRVTGAGGGGGSTASEIFQCIDVAQFVQAGGGGGSGRAVEVTRPYAPGFPNQLNIEVGVASATPSDPTTGMGVDGGDSIVTFTPECPGYEEIRGKGGKGGGVGKSTAIGEGQAGVGGDGGCGGGGAGEGLLTCGVMDFPFPLGAGGQGLDREDGEDGNIDFGGAGGLNPTANGSSGVSTVNAKFGGGGGGAVGVWCPNSGGKGGQPGSLGVSNAGGDFLIQHCGAGGGGAGLYQSTLAEVGTTIFSSGGRGANGAVDVWFYIFTVPS